MNDAEREELLEAVLGGRIPADDPRVRHAVAADPEFGRALEELTMVEEMLAATAARERAIAARAASAPPSPALDAVVAAKLTDLLGPPRGAQPTPRRRRPWPVAAMVLASAAALWVAWLLWAPAADVPDAPRGAERILAPRGPEIDNLVAEGRPGQDLTLRWRPIPGTLSRVTIFDPDATGTAAIVVENENGGETWQLTPTELRDVRPHHRWRVEALRGTEIIATSPSAPLWR